MFSSLDSQENETSAIAEFSLNSLTCWLIPNLFDRSMELIRGIKFPHFMRTAG